MRITNATKARLKHLFRFVPTFGWARRYPHLTRLEKYKLSALCHVLMKEAGGMVFSGPFSTMKLDENIALGQDPRFIVGSYEWEVYEVINQVITSAPARIIDIGAAHGYYAVGFALKIAETKVIAFEAVEEYHWKELAHLAQINGVHDKITQRGLCTLKELAETCTPNSFILSDCEGAEEDLLNPIEIPALRSCTMLVELHEFHRPNLVGTLVSRFADSHTIKMIEEGQRDASRYRILKKLPESWRTIAIEESKWISDLPPRTTTWLRFMHLTPK